MPRTAQPSWGRASIRTPASLRSFEPDVVGPLDAAHSIPGCSSSAAAQTASGTASGSVRWRSSSGRSERRVEQRLARGGGPGAALPAAAVGLLVGGDDGAVRRAGRGELAGARVGRVGLPEVPVRGAEAQFSRAVRSVLCRPAGCERQTERCARGSPRRVLQQGGEQAVDVVALGFDVDLEAGGAGGLAGDGADRDDAGVRREAVAERRGQVGDGRGGGEGDVVGAPGPPRPPPRRAARARSRRGRRRRPRRRARAGRRGGRRGPRRRGRRGRAGPRPRLRPGPRPAPRRRSARGRRRRRCRARRGRGRCRGRSRRRWRRRGRGRPSGGECSAAPGPRTAGPPRWGWSCRSARTRRSTATAAGPRSLSSRGSIRIAGSSTTSAPRSRRVAARPLAWARARVTTTRRPCSGRRSSQASSSRRAATGPTTISAGAPMPSRSTAAAIVPSVATTVRWPGQVPRSIAAAGSLGIASARRSAPPRSRPGA